MQCKGTLIDQQICGLWCIMQYEFHIRCLAVHLEVLHFSFLFTYLKFLINFNPNHTGVKCSWIVLGVGAFEPCLCFALYFPLWTGLSFLLCKVLTIVLHLKVKNRWFSPTVCVWEYAQEKKERDNYDRVRERKRIRKRCMGIKES